MATLKIQFKDSKFVSHNGVNVESFEENYVKGNGWECRITEKGRIDCIATEFYNGERHQIKLKIDKGYAKVLLKIGDGRPRAIKSYRMAMWPQDGVIVLPAGFIAGIANGIVNFFVMVLTGLIPNAILYPSISAGGVVLGFFASVLIYKEKLSKLQLTGYFIGVLSIILLNI